LLILIAGSLVYKVTSASINGTADLVRYIASSNGDDTCNLSDLEEWKVVEVNCNDKDSKDKSDNETVTMLSSWSLFEKEGTDLEQSLLHDTTSIDDWEVVDDSFLFPSGMDPETSFIHIPSSVAESIIESRLIRTPN
jgi:hypothetical protein